VTRLRPGGEAVEIWGPAEEPAGFLWRDGPHPIVQTWNRWQVHTRWWEPDEAVWRDYRKVTTETGLLCLLYHDRLDGGWFLARIYD
jgi:hypothetical protein